MALINCRECKAPVSNKAKTCPSCGIANPSGQPSGCAITLIVFAGLIALGMFASIFDDNSNKNSKAKSAPHKEPSEEQNRKNSRDESEFMERIDYHYQMLVFADKEKDLPKIDELLLLFRKYEQSNYKDVREIGDRRREYDLLESLQKTDPSDFKERYRIYNALVTISPTNEEYKKQLTEVWEKLPKDQGPPIGNSEPGFAKHANKRHIEKQFSAWDGSHVALVRLIKANMNDPDSFEHIESKYWEFDDHIVVVTSFRGKNAFGGKVINWVKAKFTIDGQLIEILEQGS